MIDSRQNLHGIGGLEGASIRYLFMYVYDLESMLAFYRDKLGFEVRYHGEGEFAFLGLGEAGGPDIALYSGRRERSVREEDIEPHWFVVINVTDLDNSVGRLQELGVDVGPIEAVPYGRAAFLNDPEGNRIELHQPN